jgi:hemerythrin-like domain-containing protein
MAHTSGQTSQETTRRLEQEKNAVDLILQQHQQVRDLFKKIRAADGKECKELVNLASDLLIVHTLLEERVFYPAMKKVDPEKIEHSLEEHQEADELLYSLNDLSYLSPGFKEKVDSLLEAVEHHVEEEEESLLPEARRTLDNLDELGEEMQALQRRLDPGHVRNEWQKSGGPH